MKNTLNNFAEHLIYFIQPNLEEAKPKKDKRDEGKEDANPMDKPRDTKNTKGYQAKENVKENCKGTAAETTGVGHFRAIQTLTVQQNCYRNTLKLLLQF